MKTWARAVVAQYPEGALLPDTWRCRLATAILYPSYLPGRLKRAAPWPGDKWRNVTMDRIGIVRKANRDGVLLAVASGQLVATYGCGWDFESAAPAVSLELVPWDSGRWWPA